jgi:hypothetical protein
MDIIDMTTLAYQNTQLFAGDLILVPLAAGNEIANRMHHVLVVVENTPAGAPTPQTQVCIRPKWGGYLSHSGS